MAKGAKRTFGVGMNEDMDPALLRRDTRPLRYKLHDFFSDHGAFVLGAIAVLIILNAIVPIGPKVHDILFFLGLGIGAYSSKNRREYPLVEPMPKNPDVIKSKDNDDYGLYLLGNEYGVSGQLWVTSSEFRTHVLVFGTTGSGKTRFLLGLLYQALLSGTGCMYVDGKGDNTVFWLTYSFCRRADRIDDLLVINYLTGGKSMQNKKLGVKYDDKRISNTTNPLSQGTAEQLRSLLVGLMRDSGGEGEMWKGRSSSMLKSLLETLVFMRDNGEINLDIDCVRHYMVLDRILELTQRDDLPEFSKLSLKAYLLELPGFTEEDAALNNINPECYKQHNFLTMQLTEIMSDLSGTYGHIYRAQLGEVDFKDLVFNSRILFVMLPALEKDPDALSGLGKMIVSGVRSALAPALGEGVEGSKSSIIDVKPTNALEPFMLILDEYGYYAVKGFSVAAAQARSLGVGIVFAGQDYPSFTKASKEEAEAIVANTTTKICMKLEDTGETAKKITERGGRAQVTQTDGYEKKNGGSSMKDRGSARAEEKDIINNRDLVMQQAGEAHVIRGDTVYRGRLFYADPVQVDLAELNKFLMVSRPKRRVLETIDGCFDKLNSIVNGEVDHKVDDSKLKMDNGILAILNDYNHAQDHGLSGSELSVVAVGGSILHKKLKEEVDLGKFMPKPKEEAAPEKPTSSEKAQAAPEKSTGPEQPSVADDTFMSSESDIKESENPRASSPSVAERPLPASLIQAEIDRHSEEDASEDNASKEREAEAASESMKSVKGEAKKMSEEFAALLTQSIESDYERKTGSPASVREKREMNPLTQIGGNIPESSNETAEDNFDVISEKTLSYPGAIHPGTPPDKERLIGLLKTVEKDFLGAEE